LCILYSIFDALIRPHEVVHLIPSWRISARQIEATSIVLLYCGNLWQKRVKLSIAAKDDPSFRRNLADPFVIWRRLRKLKAASRIMVVFN
jgi:hypothetical protein